MRKSSHASDAEARRLWPEWETRFCGAPFAEVAKKHSEGPTVCAARGTDDQREFVSESLDQAIFDRGPLSARS